MANILPHLPIWVWIAMAGLALLGCASDTAKQPGLALTGPGFDCQIRRVVDGDTVKIGCADGSTVNARLVGFDTPETNQAQCRAEKALGLRATAALRRRIAQAGAISMKGHGRDKYQRLLVTLLLDGKDVGPLMINDGLAVAYSGATRINWCNRLAA